MKVPSPDPPGHHGAAPSRGPRLAWLDIGRGLIVIAVVVVHIGVILAHRGAEVQGMLVPLGESAWVRLPVLFFLSGALFSVYRTRPWRAVVRNRVLLLGAVLVFWLVVEALVDKWLAGSPTPGVDEVLRRVGGQLVDPQGYLWFIWGLVVATVVARLLARAPWALVALAAVTVTGVVPLDGLPISWGAQNMVPYFFLGFAGAPLVLRHGHRVGPVTTVIAVGVLATVWTFVHGPRLLSGHVAVGVEILVLVVPALPAAVGVSRLLSRLPGHRVLQLVGRRTLPIYVMHLPLGLVLGVRLVDAASWLVADHPYASALVLTAVCVVVPVLAWAVLDRLRIHGVFDAPSWLLRSFDRIWPDPRPGVETAPGRRPGRDPVRTPRRRRGVGTARATAGKKAGEVQEVAHPPVVTRR